MASCSEAGTPALLMTSPHLPCPPRAFLSPHEPSRQVSPVKGLTAKHTAQRRPALSLGCRSGCSPDVYPGFPGYSREPPLAPDVPGGTHTMHNRTSHQGEDSINTAQHTDSNSEHSASVA